MPLLEGDAAARRLGVHPDTLGKWARNDKIPYVRLPDGKYRYSSEWLDELEARAKQPVVVKTEEAQAA